MTGTRYRQPTLPKAESNYADSRDLLLDRLDDFHSQQYGSLTHDQRASTGINERFRAIKNAKGGFRTFAESLINILRSQGSYQRSKEVQTEVDRILR